MASTASIVRLVIRVALRGRNADFAEVGPPAHCQRLPPFANRLAPCCDDE
jgi:hypothetical protein